MKFVRILLSIIVLVVTVIVLAVGGLYIFMDPNKLKPVLAQELKKQSGYEAVIDGNFSWSFFPRVGIKVERIALSVAKQPTPFIELLDVTFVTELGELLHGQQKLRGDIYVSTAHFLNAHAQNLHVGVHWHDGVLGLQPVTAKLYGGSVEGAVQGRNLAMLPTWSWELALKEVDLQPLLHDVNNANNKLNIAGIGQVTFRGATRGLSRNQMISNLNGTLALNVRNGKVDGVDLNYLVQTANAFVTRKPIAASSNMSETKFDSLSGTMIIRNGMVETDNLTLVSSAFGAKALGNINLFYNTINMRLTITPNNNPDVKWFIPALLTGSLEKLDVRLDTSALTRVVAQEEVQKIKAKVRDEVKEHVHGKAGEYLQELLSN